MDQHTFSEISSLELKRIIDLSTDDFFLLDVRTNEEFSIVHLGGYLIPSDELYHRTDELDKKQMIVIYCHHGVRSAKAAYLLQKMGFDKVYSLKGGIDEWAKTVDHTMSRY